MRPQMIIAREKSAAAQETADVYLRTVVLLFGPQRLRSLTCSTATMLPIFPHPGLSLIVHTAATLHSLANGSGVSPG